MILFVKQALQFIQIFLNSVVLMERKICFNSIETNIKNYSLHSGFAKPFYYSYKNRFCKLPFIASIFDFHLIDTVTNSSKVMIKCSQTTRLSHKNFIL